MLLETQTDSEFDNVNSSAHVAAVHHGFGWCSIAEANEIGVDPGDGEHAEHLFAAFERIHGNEDHRFRAGFFFCGKTVSSDGLGGRAES